MATRLVFAGLVILALSLFAVVLTGRSLYSRAEFGTWDPTAMPTGISYCDRTYLPGSHVDRATIDTIGNGFGVFSFRQVSSTADGKPIFSKPMPESVRNRFGSASPLPCDMTVYVKVGVDDYVAYGLSGGP